MCAPNKQGLSPSRSHPVYFLVAPAFGEQYTVSGITENGVPKSVVWLLGVSVGLAFSHLLHSNVFVWILFLMPTAWKPSQPEKPRVLGTIGLLFSFGGGVGE